MTTRSLFTVMAMVAFLSGCPDEGSELHDATTSTTSDATSTTDASAGTDADADASAGTDASVGTDADADTGADTGAGTDADTGSDADADAPTDATVTTEPPTDATVTTEPPTDATEPPTEVADDTTTTPPDDTVAPPEDVKPPELIAPTLTITPPNPHTLDDLVGTIPPEYVTTGLTLVWEWSGPSAHEGQVLANALTTRDQTWTLKLTVHDGFGQTVSTTASTTILNSQPQVTSAIVNGHSVCGSVTCTTQASDVDDDALTLHYAWNVNDQGVDHDAPTLDGPFEQGDLVYCVAYATDGTLDSIQRGSAPVMLVDDAPVVTAATPGYLRAGDRLVCEGTVEDDCSTPSVSYAWAVNGVPSPVTTATFDTTNMATGTTVTCVVSAGDPPAVGTAQSTTQIAASRMTLTGSIPQGFVGWDVTAIDDSNGDGLAEIVIGAPNTSTPMNNQAGAIYLVNGRVDRDNLDLLEIINGVGGRYIGGERGSFDVKTMACGPSFYVGGCPLLRDVGVMLAEIQGPEGAALGFQVGYAGDIDGDGIGDLIAATPYEIVDEIWQGRTYFLSGERLWDTGVSNPLMAARLGEGGFVFEGECGRRRSLEFDVQYAVRQANGDLTGFRTVGVGDVNGDGLGDVAVASPNNGDDDEGVVYVVFGRDDGRGVTGVELFTRGCEGTDTAAYVGPESGIAGFAAYGKNEAPSADTGQQWGKRVEAAGDFNGDGYDDVLVPSPGFGSKANKDYLLFGGATPQSQPLDGPNNPTRWEVWLGDFGPNTGRFEAFQAGGGGDTNGDGKDDLAFVGADRTHTSFLGVLYGRASDDNGIIRTDESYDNSGRGFYVGGFIDLDSESGVTRIFGDTDGDGFDDVAVGSPLEGSPDAGAVFVVFGGNPGPSGINLTKLRAGDGGYAIEPKINGEKYGYALAGGDVDGDGLDDLIVGAPSATVGVNARAGRVQVIFGRDYRGIFNGHYGGPEDDTIEGTSAGDSLIGGRGDDHLVGGGGADVLYGGAGDDVLELDGDGWRRVNGGAGKDTLVLGQGVTGLDLEQVGNRIRAIEALQLNGQALTLGKRRVVRLSDVDNRLVVMGSGKVTVPVNDHWRNTGTFTNDDGTFIALEDGEAELWIATTLETVIPPSVFTGERIVPENSAAGAVVATLDAVDPDGLASGLRWTLVSDESGAFAVDATTGGLRVVNAAKLDFETAPPSWDVTVRVTDEDGLITEGTFTIKLEDLNEPPAFVDENPVWSLEEDTVGVLGQVTAFDQDHDDVLTYVISSDPHALFDVDPATGEVTLIDGLGFDYETDQQHYFDVDVTDSHGLVDTISVRIEVGDVDVVERDMHVVFDLRDWSIWEDGEANQFDGFQIEGLTDQEITSNCAVQPSEDQEHVEQWNAPLSGFLAQASVLPIKFDAHYTGAICTHNWLTYDGGSANATIPVDIHMEVPDELVPDQSYTLNSSYTVQKQDAKMWGKTTGFEAGWQIQFADFGIYMALCENLFGSGCKEIVNRGGLNKTFQDKVQTLSKNWQADYNADEDGLVLDMDEAVVNDPFNVAIDWDHYIFQAASILGFPSNHGRYEWELDGSGGGAGQNLIVRFDYTLLQTEVGFQAENDWWFDLDVSGVVARMYLEGNMLTPAYTWNVGTPITIKIPAARDIDGDGRVKMVLIYELESEFHNQWTHTSRSGYMYTGGFGRVRIISGVDGPVLQQHQVGPAIDHACLPKVGGAPATAAVLYCYGHTDVDDFTFPVTGFSAGIVQGQIDLAH